MLLIAAMLSSVVPLWLVVSPCITGIFLAHHPLRQHLLGEMSSVSGGGRSERTADAMAAKMAGVWGGVAVVPLLLLAPGLRVLVSCALCAGAFACARWRERLLRRLLPAVAPTSPASPGVGVGTGGRGAGLRSLREWWDLLPAPSVVNTAEEKGE